MLHEYYNKKSEYIDKNTSVHFPTQKIMIYDNEMR